MGEDSCYSQKIKEGSESILLVATLLEPICIGNMYVRCIVCDPKLLKLWLYASDRISQKNLVPRKKYAYSI